MSNSNVNSTDLLSQPITKEQMEALFSVLLKRPVNNEGWKKNIFDSGLSIENFIKNIRNSEELGAKIYNEYSDKKKSKSIDQSSFRIPTQLSRNKNDSKKVFLIGSCLLNSWREVLEDEYDNLNINRIVFNNASVLPEMSDKDILEYDFQILQLPLRSILKEAWYYPLKAGDEQSYQVLFDKCCQQIKINLDALMKYNLRTNIPSFIMNFYTPIQNPLGRAQDRYSYSNMVFFIEKLNEFIYNHTKIYKNTSVIDIDQIANTFGKKYIQDDFLTHTNHGSVANDIRMKVDMARLEPAGSVDELYTPNVPKFIKSVYEEVLAAFKTSNQVDSIKLVIFDLDDTLWRGVAAEMDDPDPSIVEGWPLGILEAASYLWRRGILIAIASKNDEANVRRIWKNVFGARFSIDNFASIKINWRPKAENIGEILKEVNLLPGSVLFVDDNPVERQFVKEAYPTIRVLDAPLAEWRRVLLWAPELQRENITSEASSRTEMIKAQIEREQLRVELSHEDFLKTLNIEVMPKYIDNGTNQKFERCFELLNKTNQFNTTGRRWTKVELMGFLDNGGKIIGFEVKDNFTSYGLVGLILLDTDLIVQFVMSCRVFGMGVEDAIIWFIASSQHKNLRGVIVENERNKLSSSLFERLGFKFLDDHWMIDSQVLQKPEHIIINDL